MAELVQVPRTGIVSRKCQQLPVTFIQTGFVDISIHQVAQIFGPGLDVAVFVLFDAYPLCMFVNLRSTCRQRPYVDLHRALISQIAISLLDDVLTGGCPEARGDAASSWRRPPRGEAKGRPP